MLKQPVFLICSERSGSNLIRVVMNSHKDIYAPMPLHLVRRIWGNIYKYGNLALDDNWNMLKRHTVDIINNQIGQLNYEIGIDELNSSLKSRSFKALFEIVYETGLRISGKEKLFLKVNECYQFIYFLNYHYPDAKFVFQVRDPRDVVLSMLKLPMQGGLFRSIQTWKRDQTAAIKALYTLGAEKAFLHRYEDFLSNPEKVLRSLCSFLEVDFDKNMIEFEDDPHTQKSSSLSVAWENLNKPLLKNNFGKYKKELSQKEIEIIEYNLEELMEHYGYSADYKGLQLSSKILVKLGNTRFRNIAELFFLHKQLRPFDGEDQRRKVINDIYKRITTQRDQLAKKYPYTYE